MSEHGKVFIVFERPEGSLAWTIAYINGLPAVRSNETFAQESAAIVETRRAANGKRMRAHVATVQLPWTEEDQAILDAWKRDGIVCTDKDMGG